MEGAVALLPTHRQALAYRKRLARKGAAFGVVAKTPAAWLGDAFALYDDGRLVVTPLERAFAVHSLLSSCTGDSTLSSTDGVATLIARFFADALGSDELERAVARPPEGLSEAEREVLALVEPYRALLAEHGLVEQGDALRFLEAKGLVPAIEMPVPFTLPAPFVRVCGAGGTEPARITPPAAGVEPRFLFAAGPSAQNALVADHLVRSLFGADSFDEVLVVCADPLSAYRALALPLSERGAFCAVRASCPFAQTDFGRAYRAIMEFLQEEPHDLRALMDYFDSPISGVESDRAAQIDAMLRGDRLVSFDEACALARLMSPQFELFEELAADADASLLLDRLSDVVADLPGRDVAWRTEQVAAVSALRRIYEQARSWGAEPADLSFALAGLGVSASRGCGAGPKSVTLCDVAEARQLIDERFDEVVLCDLDARFVAASEEHTALSTLEAKLGLARPAHALADARVDFEHVKSLATHAFTCERVLSAGGDEDVYPAFTLEEYVELFRAPGDALDRLGLPPSLARAAVVRGEDLLSANAHPGLTQAEPIELAAVKRGALSSTAGLHTSWAYPSGGAGAHTPVLSPSALETYVNCPYRWFVAQRVRPEAPDEGLGPLEQGTFAHAVFESFYVRLEGATGAPRVTPDTLEAARRTLSEAFDDVLAVQPGLDGVRYVPLTPTERAEAERLRRLLLDNLALQARWTPSFAPVQHERVLSPDEGIDYAGVRLRGRVDRIDVSAQTGHYVIVDYKGSIAGHDAGFDPDKAEGDFQLPHKIQALIYAQALRGRMGAARPVGALYLSYRAREPRAFAAGSFDESLLDLGPFARAKSAVRMNFEAYLDQVEQAVARRVERMVAGEVAPDPLCADSCRYCLVVGCERRLP